jgi:hypothetical protein
MDDNSTHTTSSVATQTRNDAYNEEVINGEEKVSDDGMTLEH